MASGRSTARQLYPAAPDHVRRVQGPVEVPRRHRRTAAETLSIPYCLFLTVACILTLVFGAYYLQQQALATSSQKKLRLSRDSLRR